VAKLDKQLLERPFPRVKLHPASLKHLKKGHPWVTKDSFTKDFPLHRSFLIGLGAREDNEECLLLNDPEHPKVKARLWSFHGDFIEQIKNFPYQVRQRLAQSFMRRQKIIEAKERENICLVFYENDFLPGLHITWLNGIILVQLYSRFWHPFKNVLIEEIQRAIKDVDLPLSPTEFWFQQRNQSQEQSFDRYDLSAKKKRSTEKKIEISEFNNRFIVRLNNKYDLGLYTDMAYFRKSLGEEFKNKKVLNLYAYTGAYSIHALNKGAKEVHSVDLSHDALSWLDENLKINPEIETSKHHSHATSVKKALKGFAQNQETFDWIICDPPSASSDGKKTTNALKSYESDLSLMLSILDKEKGKMAIFLNTLQVSAGKFKSHIESLLKDNPDFTIYRQLKNKEDCTPLPQFPEGQNLKGLLIGPRKK
jgi:23S rRNA (cytosine1962-C5)-methyltransferase